LPREKQKEEIVHQSKSDRPHYHSFLPKVFPFKYRSTSNSISFLGMALAQRMEEATLGQETIPDLYHAVTGHPAYRDEYLDLWLSKGAAEWLVSQDLIPSDAFEETIK
jgi:hypothetical protein